MEAARQGGGWSLSGVCAHLDDVIDDEGRPISERRATPEARRDVPFDVAPCAYGDYRDGHLMNVSALGQITRHLKAVIADIRGFRALLDTYEEPWFGMLTSVLDQFAGPARHLLETGGDRVPATLAVGHKLAAGYLGVLTQLLEDNARDGGRPATADQFLEYVESRKLLLGASEPCAGPPKQIAFLTRVLLGEERASVHPDARSHRLAVARALASQLLMGAAWKLFDEYVEHRLLFGAWVLHPRYFYIGERVEQRCGEIDPARAAAALTASKVMAIRCAATEDFLAAVADFSHSETAKSALSDCVQQLVERGEGALLVGEKPAARTIAHDFASYLMARNCLVTALREQEREIRSALGFASEPPVVLGSLALPRSRALHWFQILLGHRVEFSDVDRLCFHNHRRRLEVALAPG